MKIPRFFLLACIALAGSSEAALLVYDGYSYGSGAMSTKNPDANTVGLDTNVAYSGGGVANFTAVASSLTFGNLVTTGGAVSFATGTNVMAGAVSLGSGSSSPYSGANVYSGGTSYSGTLYSSFLFRLTVTPTSTTAFQSRVADSISTSAMRFMAAPDSRVGGTAAASISYDTSDATTGVPTTGTVTLANNTTYLAISSFTNVGTTLTAANQSVASLYILTAAQFAEFINAGATESYLNSATIGGGSAQITERITDGNNATSGTPTFGNGAFVQYLSISNPGTLDETRYGTTLADVVPVIPEPSTLAIALGSAALLLRRRRK